MLDVVEELFQQGVEPHKSGKVKVSSQLDTAVLKTHPEHSTSSLPSGYHQVNESLRTKCKSILDKTTLIDTYETDSNGKVYVSDSYVI